MAGCLHGEPTLLDVFFGCTVIGLWFWSRGRPTRAIGSGRGRVLGLAAADTTAHLQVAPTGAYPQGIRTVFTELIAQEGVRGLFRGLGAANARAFPAAAAQFAGYEMAVRFFRWMDPDKNTAATTIIPS